MSLLTVVPPQRAPNPAESARYTKEMLESLRKIAIGHNQMLLAHLLDLAAHEAKALGAQIQN